ncbi:MAG: lysophospholipid acyltransferase family protein, partial [Candidatus Aminicenantales bacterium]
MRTIILVFLYTIMAILLLPVLFICYLGRWPNVIILIGKWALSLGKKIIDVEVEVSGLDNIDKKTAYVFMANHLSFLDGPLLFLLIPQPVRVILKKEVFRLPIIGQGMKQLNFIPVDRKKL